MAISTPSDILEYWFIDSARDALKAKERLDFWFRATPEHDREIAQRFSATLEAAADGSLSHWETEPHAALALVIVLDQFPRNIHRATPAAFAYDAEALSVARHGVGAGYLRGLTTIEQGFFVMPYQHCEDLTCQRESVALSERITNDAAPEWRLLAEGMLHYARLHLELIERFGRFPHRNAILGRTSTPAEIEFLRTNSESFGQSAR
ncbi:MAG TPA: DUF924 family protein [Burkholderiales bacterium]|nr:DUF924 family protein [Burkholderiales bacterium]